MAKETEPPVLTQKLIAAARADYPAAAEILVSFPNDWTLVHAFKRDELPLYVAGMPPSQERGRADHFFGLSAEINRSLTTYRLYKLFEPWPRPVVPVVWDQVRGEGRVLPGGRLEVQLQPLGQAQAWYGPRDAVLWECYVPETRRVATWQEELTQFWRAVEADLGVSRVFTLPREPTFVEGYTEFLAGLGYAPDAAFPQWWSKGGLGGESHSP
jgi:hypothetical protein